MHVIPESLNDLSALKMISVSISGYFFLFDQRGETTWSRGPSWSIMGRWHEHKWSSVVFHPLDLGFVCFHSITQIILTDTADFVSMLLLWNVDFDMQEISNSAPYSGFHFPIFNRTLFPKGNYYIKCMGILFCNSYKMPVLSKECKDSNTPFCIYAFWSNIVLHFRNIIMASLCC